MTNPTDGPRDINEHASDASPEPRAPYLASDAGTDKSFAERLARDPESCDARLDNALDESMDASDPPASTQPFHDDAHDLPESSGFDPEMEKQFEAGKPEKPGLIERVINKVSPD